MKDKDTKILGEAYQLILELAFNNSPDEDSPGKKQTIVLSREEKYPIKQGNTHGGESHSIKHFIEFEPEIVTQYINNAINYIKTLPEVYVLDKNGNIVMEGDQAKKSMNNNNILNLFDLINDKVLNQQQLLESEQYIQNNILTPMSEQYYNLIEQYESSAVDIDQDPVAGEQAFSQGGVIKFKGEYSNNQFIYYLNISNTGLIATDDQGVVSTAFRIDKRGNDLNKVRDYFSRGVKVFSKKLNELLGIVPAQQPQAIQL